MGNTLQRTRTVGHETTIVAEGETGASNIRGVVNT